MPGALPYEMAYFVARRTYSVSNLVLELRGSFSWLRKTSFSSWRFCYMKVIILLSTVSSVSALAQND